MRERAITNSRSMQHVRKIFSSVGGIEHSTLPADHVLDNLRQSGASLHVVTVVNTAMRAQSNPSTPEGLLGEALPDWRKV